MTNTTTTELAVFAALLSFALIAVCSITLFALKPYSNQTMAQRMSEMRKVAGNYSANIYAVTIDDKEYLVVLGSNKAAICRK